MATAGEIITEAREIHPELHEEFNPEPTVLRFLSRYNRELVSKTIRSNPDELAVWETIALPFATFDAGEALTPAIVRFEADVKVQGSGDTIRDKLHIVPVGERWTTRVWPAAYVVADQLYLLRTDGDWTQWTEIRVRHVAIPADITATGTAMTLPDTANDAYIYALADFMAFRLDAEIPIDRNRIRQDLRSAEQRYLDEVAGRAMSMTAMIGDVW